MFQQFVRPNQSVPSSAGTRALAPTARTKQHWIRGLGAALSLCLVIAPLSALSGSEPARAAGSPTITGSNYYGIKSTTKVYLSTIRDTVVTIYGTDLQGCTSLTAMGGGWNGNIPVTPSADGTSATFTFNDWEGKSGVMYGWAAFNCANPGNFFSQAYPVFPFFNPTRTISATKLTPGGVVTVEFSNYDTFFDVTEVKFDGVAATDFTVVDSSKLQFTVPDGVINETNCIEVTNMAGPSQWCPSTGQISLPVNPTVGSIAPTSGSTAGGTEVTITGTGFAAGATVSIGGVPCTSPVITSTTITCTTGAATAGTADVVVTNTDSGTTTKTDFFTFAAPIVNPTVGSIAPTSGSTAGGTSVTVTGTGFVAGATVTIGGVPCTSSVITSTTISCTTGAGAAGSADVVVTNSDSGTTTEEDLFTFVAPIVNPTVGSISPSRVSHTGGTPVTITGTGFTLGSTVTIGGVPCTSPVITSTTITCTTGAGAAGSADVVVTNADSGTTTATGMFSYVANDPSDGGGVLARTGPEGIDLLPGLAALLLLVGSALLVARTVHPLTSRR